MTFPLPSQLSANLFKRRVFISYHHEGDQYWYDTFSTIFHDLYELITDRSVDRVVDSDDPEYVLRRIRENHISGMSCTIVLCGPETPKRKYVGGFWKPNRLHDNLLSGYALQTAWWQLQANPAALKPLLEQANARPTYIIANSRPMMNRNEP